MMTAQVILHMVLQTVVQVSFSLVNDLMSTVGSTIDLNAPAFFEDSELNKIGDTYY